MFFIKNLFLTLIILTSFSCKAQTPIFPRYNNLRFAEVEGAYYKDVNNFQDQFVGTWVYTNGNTLLKVVFKKIPLYYNTVGNIKYYEDFLVGEYQYIENGIQKTNSLASLNNNTNETIYDYNLYSTSKIKPASYPKCTECLAGEERLILSFNEPTRRYGHGMESRGPGGYFIIRRVNESGIAKIKVQFIKTTSAIDAPSPELEDFSLPYGNYTLIKQ